MIVAWWQNFFFPINEVLIDFHFHYTKLICNPERTLDLLRIKIHILSRLQNI
jgi:hypothetical protein